MINSTFDSVNESTDGLTGFRFLYPQSLSIWHRRKTVTIALDIGSNPEATIQKIIPVFKKAALKVSYGWFQARSSGSDRFFIQNELSPSSSGELSAKRSRLG